MKTFTVKLYYSMHADTSTNTSILTVAAPDQEAACWQASDTVRARPGVKNVMVEDSEEVT